jgi:hypothetical protein
VIDRETEVAAADIMARFAERTGLTARDRPSRRYLWTDAFAVCNFLGLARATGGAEFRELAAVLVDDVHRVLGRHRPDDHRRGWISGSSDADGSAHPTRGGLRIGKPLPERRPDEPYDARLEWDRDGQYFHYLTKWMHALDRVHCVVGDPNADLWARELAAAAHAGFTYVPAPGVPERMVWKASIDLRRPLVASMGQHDPIDGLVTYLQLEAHRSGEEGPDLAPQIAEMRRIVATIGLDTDDPLGIGGLLFDAYRIEQLARSRASDGRMLPALLAAAADGLARWLRARPLDRPARQRLAFRELGLAIGLHAVERMWTAAQRDPSLPSGEPRVHALLEALMGRIPVRAAIESAWLDPAERRGPTWIDHLDINEVMLATMLLPDGFLEIR